MSESPQDLRAGVSNLRAGLSNLRAGLSNLHMHTTYSDGKNTMEECVKAALQKGFVSLGFSDHAPAFYDECGMKPERMPEYFEEFAGLKKKYAGRIELYLGLENDFYAPYDGRHGTLDFVIGSAHNLKMPDGRYLSIDYKHEMMHLLIEAYGGIRPVVEQYYRLIREIAARQKPDVLGHLDLITKLNAGNRYFDPEDVWYKAAVDETVRVAVESGCIVEVNTGAMARGYTDTPYPSRYILDRLFELGAPICISSDAHSAETLDFAFSRAAELLKKVGYTTAKQLHHGLFVDVCL